MKSTLTLSFAALLTAAILSLSACNKEGPVAPNQPTAANGSQTTTNTSTTLTTEGNEVKSSDTGTTASNNDPSSSGETPKSNLKRVKVAFIDADGKPTGAILVPRVEKTEAEWRKLLTPEQYAVVRSKGTERAFCGTLLDNKKEGIYFCVACELPLFASNAKFNSGTGWPSFFQPVAKENVAEHADFTYGVRTEILCARCDGHLGHVFDDGPRPTGLRYCLNSESLTFTESTKLKPVAEKFAKEIEAAKKAQK